MLREQVDVVVDNHQVANLETWIHAAGGIAHEKRGYAKFIHHAYGKCHFLHRVSLVEMETPVHSEDVLAAELAKDELAGVSFNGRDREIGYVFVCELYVRRYL